MTDQINLLEPNRSQPPAQPDDELRSVYSAPQPRQVEHIDRAALRQRLGDRRPPPPRARKTVDKHRRRTIPEESVLDTQPIDLKPP